MSITIVRFNSIPVCQLAPNFVSPMLLVVQIHPAAPRAVSAPLPRLHLRAALPPFSPPISLTQFAFLSFWRGHGLLEIGGEFAAELLNLLCKNSQRSKESGFLECVLRRGIQDVARFSVSAWL